MKALSDPNRVRFLKALEKGEWCVCHFQDASGLAQPTVSRHMQVLEAAGLAVPEKRGQWVHYRLAGEGASPYAAALLRVLSGWLNATPDTAAFLERMGQSRRRKSCEAEARPGRGCGRKRGIAGEPARAAAARSERTTKTDG